MNHCPYILKSSVCDSVPVSSALCGALAPISYAICVSPTTEMLSLNVSPCPYMYPEPCIRAPVPMSSVCKPLSQYSEPCL